MDAHAHLLSLGWAGPGHSLDSRPYKQKGHRGLAYDPSKVGNTGNGLVKPLLISQKHGRLGVGKKAHEPQAGNEWWLKGFETALGNIGKSESERTSGTATPVAYEYSAGKHNGLYSFFVKGQQMEGTIEKLDANKSSSKKRKSDVFEGEEEEEEEEEEAEGSTASFKRSKKQQTAADFEQVGAYMAIRDKDERRRKQTTKPSPVDQFRQIGEYLEVRSEMKKRGHKSEAQPSEVSSPSGKGSKGEDEEGPAETKEERRERRRHRNEEKERLRALSAHEKDQPSHPVEDDAAKAARRAERKKRKAEKAAKSS